MVEVGRELLELAARAAGIEIDKSSYNGGGTDNDGFNVLGDAVLDWHNNVTWNPLTSDRDAFRLATALGLSIEPYPYYDTPKHSVIVKQRRRGDMMRGGNPTEVVETYGDDPMAATRRAIVRSAALVAGAQP